MLNSELIIETIRARYPIRSRVRLTRMDDSQAPPLGTIGTVIGVDDYGTIHVCWDNGSNLGVAFPEDECVLV